MDPVERKIAAVGSTAALIVIGGGYFLYRLFDSDIDWIGICLALAPIWIIAAVVYYRSVKLDRRKRILLLVIGIPLISDAAKIACIFALWKINGFAP